MSVTEAVACRGQSFVRVGCRLHLSIRVRPMVRLVRAQRESAAAVSSRVRLDELAAAESRMWGVWASY